ncbi:hypothetical protein GCM10027514_21640 [Azotobacter armeniacus]
MGMSQLLIALSIDLHELGFQLLAGLLLGAQSCGVGLGDLRQLPSLIGLQAGQISLA